MEISSVPRMEAARVFAYTTLRSASSSSIPSEVRERISSKCFRVSRSSSVITRLSTSSSPRIIPSADLRSPFLMRSSISRTFSFMTGNGPFAIHASAPKAAKSTSTSADIADRTTMNIPAFEGSDLMIRHSRVPSMFGMMRST